MVGGFGDGGDAKSGVRPLRTLPVEAETETFIIDRSRSCCQLLLNDTAGNKSSANFWQPPPPPSTRNDILIVNDRKERELECH